MSSFWQQWKQILQIQIVKPLVLGIKSNAQGHTFIQPGIHPALTAACQSKNQGVLELICQQVISPSNWPHFQKL